MSLFFDRTKVSKIRELGVYIFYYLSIALVVQSFGNVSFNMIANCFLIFVLTLNYPSSWRWRLWAVSMIYAILLTSETITTKGLETLWANYFTEMTRVQYLIGQIIARVTSYLLVLALGNLKVVKGKIEVPLSYWVAILTVPLGTLLPTYTLLVTQAKGKGLLLTASVVALFMVNLLVFYLYDRIVQSYQDKMDKKLLQTQNKMHLKQIETIIQTEENTRLLRHDLKQHLLTLQKLNTQKDHQGIADYLQNILGMSDPPQGFVRSKNAAIDSVVNYHISEAQKQGITILARVDIREAIRIEPFDLSMILGNGLDNAITATAQVLTETKEINLTIILEKNMLSIYLVNPYSGNILKAGDDYLTDKVDQANHGYGLKSIQKAVDKYQGTMDIDEQNHQFSLTITLFNQS